MTVSESADSVFCPEAWRLAQIGARSANQNQRDTGTRHHANLGYAGSIACGFITLGRILVIGSLLALAASR